MVLPDLARLMACHHEAGHFVAAQALGIPVDRVTVLDEPTDGRMGFCRHPDLVGVPTRHYLLVLAAGAHTVMAFFPEVGTELAAGGGYSDFLRIDELLRGRFPDTVERRSAARWLAGAADRFVVEFAGEIRTAADRLYRTGEIVTEVAA